MMSFEYLDDLFEPVLIIDKSESIIYFNSSFLTLFKTTPRLMQKQTNVLNYLGSIVPDFELHFRKILEHGHAISSELDFYFEDQAYTLIIKGVKKDNSYIMFSFKDVTVEKILNDKYRAQLEELKSSYSQVLQFDKLKVIGEMTANISHEINNPLTVAVGNAELIEFCLEASDINTQKENIEKYNQVNGGVPILLVNKAKVEQVFVNLIQNAIDSLKDSSTKDPRIDIDLTNEKNGNFTRIDVKDNGPGINSDNREKIFNAFYTTKEVGKGTGLGLSISSQIIQSQQGKLQLIDSDHGAHFRVTLPAIGIAGLVNGNWKHQMNEGDKVKRIMVVDNEINILNLCLNFLSETNYSFLGVASANEALRELERSSIHMIITDLKMPDMDGETFDER